MFIQVSEFLLIIHKINVRGHTLKSSEQTDLPAFPKEVRLYLLFADFDFDISVRTDYRSHRRIAVKKHIRFYETSILF